MATKRQRQARKAQSQRDKQRNQQATWHEAALPLTSYIAHLSLLRRSQSVLQDSAVVPDVLLDLLAAIVCAVTENGGDAGNVFQLYLHSLSAASHTSSCFYHYVKKVLRRSKTSMSTFLLAVFYLTQLKSWVVTVDALKDDEDTLPPSAPLPAQRSQQTLYYNPFRQHTVPSSTENDSGYNDDRPHNIAAVEQRRRPKRHDTAPRPKRLHPRQAVATFQPPTNDDITHMLFLGALITADKYLNDGSWTNAKWGEFANLSLEAVNEYEMRFLEGMDWRMTVCMGAFDAFVRRLQLMLVMQRMRWVMRFPMRPAQQPADKVMSLAREEPRVQLTYQDMLVLLDWLGLESVLTVVQWRVALGLSVVVASVMATRCLLQQSC
ncbi:hypothetical protein RI367_008021 [Sorochytrium milnesiophthora]